MSNIRYQPGDTITLRPRYLGSNEPRGTGRIVSVLPETQVSVRYRARLQNENFDRIVSQDDIDHSTSSATNVEKQGVPTYATGSTWVNLKSIKTRK